MNFSLNTEGFSTGILLVLSAYFMFTLADSTTKWLALSGIPAIQLAFLRYGVHGFICSLDSIYRGVDRTEITENFSLLIIRGALLTIATVMNFYALKYLVLSMYSAIMFSVPIFVCILSWPMLAERVGPWRWCAIIVGFIGVLIIVRPFDESFHWAGLLTLAASISMAVYSIITRKLAFKVRPHVMQFFTGIFGTLTLLPFAIWLWAPLDLNALLLIGWIGTASWAGHELLTRAHKFADASVLMPYSYSFIIYMSLAGYLIYAEVPDSFTIMGTIVLVVAGLFIWYREKQLQKRNADLIDREIHV